MQSGAATKLALEKAPGLTNPVFSPLLESADQELNASLHLLAERARLVTTANSVAIAIDRNGRLVYSAAAGQFAADPGAEVDGQQDAIRECVKTKQPVRKPAGTDSLSTMLVPVLRENKLAGLIELTRAANFDQQDLDEVVRLAEMVSTAIDHHEATERIETRLFEEDIRLHEEATPLKSWHAPESSDSEATKDQDSQDYRSEIGRLQTCGACGFPVSPGRDLCLDCEPKHPAGSHAPAELFAISQKESWISEHGYTIASLLLTVIAAIIILWLR